jgi:hypothetical protein
MDITFQLGFTGTPDATDVRAAKYAVKAENQKRATQNLDPLPSSTGAELKASYLAVLLQEVDAAHGEWLKRSVENVRAEFTTAQIDLLNAKLRDRLTAGETPDAIIADLTA